MGHPQGMGCAAEKGLIDPSKHGSTRDNLSRAIVFALCYFHAALLERKTFGVGNLPQSTSGLGWNMNYPYAVLSVLGVVIRVGHARDGCAAHASAGIGAPRAQHDAAIPLQIQHGGSHGLC